MPTSTVSNASQTATLNTNHTLVTATAPTGGASYVLRLSAVNLANGETLILRLQTRSIAGDPLEDAYAATYQHVQGEPIKLSPVVPVEAGNDLVAILRQEGGTGRVYKWRLLRIDG